MKTKIAVATTSGKAYYQLVSELKRKHIPFITTRPGEAIPFNIEVALTTKAEKSIVRCSTTLTYDERADPSIIVEKALQTIRGKKRYRNLVIGVDPGKKFGLAVVGDGSILETKSVSNERVVALEITQIMGRFESRKKVVKIGNGAENYQMKIVTILDEELPAEVNIELVEEGGTTRGVDIPSGRSVKDAYSAVKISMRNGCKIPRCR